MNDTQLLTEMIQGIATQAFILIVAVIGVFVTITRWKDAPSSGIWSLLGFGMAALLCVLVPVSNASVRYWMMHNPGHALPISTTFTILAVVWSLLRAVSYIFLLVAIFAGRPQTTTTLESPEAQ